MRGPSISIRIPFCVDPPCAHFGDFGDFDPRADLRPQPRPDADAVECALAGADFDAIDDALSGANLRADSRPDTVSLGDPESGALGRPVALSVHA